MLAFSGAMLVEGPGGPSVSDWSLLVFGIVTGTPCLSGLCLCVFLFIASSILCFEKNDDWQILVRSTLTFHVYL